MKRTSVARMVVFMMQTAWKRCSALGRRKNYCPPCCVSLPGSVETQMVSQTDVLLRGIRSRLRSRFDFFRMPLSPIANGSAHRHETRIGLFVIGELGLGGSGVS